MRVVIKWFPVSPLILIKSPTLNSSRKSGELAPTRAPLDCVHAYVPVRFPSDAALSPGHIESFKLFPSSPAHFAIKGPVFAKLDIPPPIAPPCSGTKVW